MHSQTEFHDDIPAIDRMLERSQELHSAPQVARALLNLTRSLEYDVRDVVACLERDPALAAKLLRMVNSSRYGLLHPVSNLRQAVTLLGQRSLRVLALTFSLVEGLTRGPAALLYQDYWKRALTMATAAGRLVRNDRAVSPNDAYTAGLLSDLGVLVLAQNTGDVYQKIWSTYAHGPELVDAERQQFGFGHPALGARLLQLWDFPVGLVDAALCHHEDRDDTNSLEIAVHAGDLLANVLWTRQSPAPLKTLLEERYGYDIDQFIGLAKFCQDDITLDSEIFGITLSGEIDCDFLMTEASRQIGSSDSTGQDASLLADPPELVLSLPNSEETQQDGQHLGHIEVRIFRDNDALRQGVRCELGQLSTYQAIFHTPVPLAIQERVHVQIKNETQRFLYDMDGLVQTCQQRRNGQYDIELALCSLLRKDELAALRRAGGFDAPRSEKVWL